MTAVAAARAAGLAAALAAAAFPARGDGASAACRASSEVRPSRAVVGQQIHYTARIAQRDDVETATWVRPLAFPGFRAEWLPSREEATQIEGHGVSFRVHDENRALFGARPGQWEIPAATLRCRIAAGGARAGAARFEEVTVPGVRVRIDPVPDDGRPADWSGLVGAVRVQAVAEPQTVALGGSVQLSVQVSGAGDLFALPPPLDADRGVAGADVFARPSETVRDPGGRLGMRRYFRFDLVPRATGTTVIPALRVPYFDPGARRFAVALSRPIAIRVTPAPASAVQRGEPTPPRTAAPGEENRGGGTGRWLAGLAAAGVLLGLGIWRLGRGRAHPWRSVDAALDAAERAACEGDRLAEARELSRALRAALRATAPALASLDPDTLSRRAGSAANGAPVDPPLLRELAAQLAALDWIRFSDEVGHPDREAARAVVARLRTAS